MHGNYSNLRSFVEEVERREGSKEDYVAHQGAIEMAYDSQLVLEGQGMFGINDHAHGQIATTHNIPKAYYDRMGEIPGLRTQNVNSWMKASPASKRFVRILDGEARAFLSDRFRPIDNYELLNTSIIPALDPLSDSLQVLSTSLSPRKMYMQIVFPTLQAEVKAGDIVQYGITISNSEVGAGAVNVEELIWRLICENGMKGVSMFKKHHLGRRMDQDYGMFSDETVKQELVTYQMQLKDIITSALKDKDGLMSHVRRLQGAMNDAIVDAPTTVENVTKRYGITQDKTDPILETLYKEGKNRYGLAQAITALAHSTDNPDDQDSYESTGGKIITLTNSEWKVLAS